MDNFVSRKRRRLSPPIGDPGCVSPREDEDSTDLKLAMLASLHPHLEQQVLLDILLACEGSVEAASASLISPDSFSPKKHPTAPGYQSSLANFAVTSDTNKRPKLLSKKGKTLYLYSPEDVAANTPCSIIHNFLPAKDANELLEELLLEAPSFEKITFKLFDNVVSSPHTSCFYVETLEEMKKQKTEYVYNGDLLTVSQHKSLSSTNSWLASGFFYPRRLEFSFPFTHDHCCYPYGKLILNVTINILTIYRTSAKSRPLCGAYPLKFKKQ
jgi:hypothetical protein